MPSETNTAPIWVLLGARRGDNQQLLAIAKAMKLPFRAIPLSFNPAAALEPVLLGAGRLSWRSELPLQAPWPQAVLAAGRKSVPAARWIRRQSQGRTRLIHINRPWAPLSWFDLVVTTPQYALPERPNVQLNLLPFMPPRADDVPLASALPGSAASLPRPWTAVLVGGHSRPYALDADAARSLADRVNAEVRRTGGSAWVFDSPRTPQVAMDIVGRSLDVPSRIVPWRGSEALYGALLGSADRFIVTADSASMLTEALLSGRPVTPFALSKQPDWRWRAVSAWRAAAIRAPSSWIARAFDAVVDLGLLSSVRDLGLLHLALEKAGVFSGDGQALLLAEGERRATMARIATLLEGAPARELALAPATATPRSAPSFEVGAS